MPSGSILKTTVGGWTSSRVIEDGRWRVGAPHGDRDDGAGFAAQQPAHAFDAQTFGRRSVHRGQRHRRPEGPRAPRACPAERRRCARSPRCGSGSIMTPMPPMRCGSSASLNALNSRRREELRVAIVRRFRHRVDRGVCEIARRGVRGASALAAIASSSCASVASRSVATWSAGGGIVRRACEPPRRAHRSRPQAAPADRRCRNTSLVKSEKLSPTSPAT